MEVLLKLGPWGGQPGGRYGGVDVPWRGAVPARAEYLPQNVRHCAPVCDNLLWGHRLASAQSLSDSRHIIRDKLINRTDFALDDIWDKPAPQYVGSVSRYLWIAAWSAFWIAYNVNNFLRITYGVNLFIGIAICRIVDS